MKKCLLVVVFLALTLTWGSSAWAEVIKITVDARGGEAETTRVTIFNDAVEALNKQLKKEGSDIQVKLQKNFFVGDRTDHMQRFILASKAGVAPDIFEENHDLFAILAKAGYVIPLDDYVEKYWKGVYDDFYAGLWASAKYAGKTWTIPQDSTAAVIYFNKTVLRKLGWDEKRINKMVEDVEKGTFTLQDMGLLAKEAVDKGAAKSGIYHRPSHGGWYQVIYLDHGGKLQDPVSGKLVLDKSSSLAQLQFYYDLVHTWKVTPKGMTSMDWRVIRQNFLQGDALFWLYGSWEWGGLPRSGYYVGDRKVDEDFMWENIGFMLVPAPKKGGIPATLSQPFSHGISSSSKYPEIAFRLVTFASSPELVARHAILTGHLAVRKASTEVPMYKNDKFTTEVTKMLKYTNTLPNHPLWGKYRDLIYQSVQAVEVGGLKPAEALEWLVDQMKTTLKDEVEIIE